MRNHLGGLAALILTAGLVGLNSCAGSDGMGPDCDPIAAALVSRVELTPSSARISPGGSLQLQATAFSCAGQLTGVTTFHWRGSNDDIATIDSAGLVSALHSGNVTMYASTSGQEGSAAIVVEPAQVNEVRVEPSDLTLIEHEAGTLTVRAFDSDGKELFGRQVDWSSAHPSVATVDDHGEVFGVSAGGPIAVTATIEGKSGASQITVEPAPVDEVRVEPSSLTLSEHQTGSLTARAFDAHGTELFGRKAEWTSDQPSVATVDGHGKVTGVSAGGPVAVTATIEGRSDASQITVIGLPVSRVEVSPPSANIRGGETVQLTARLTDAFNHPLTGRVVTWSSSDGTVASVDQSTGLVTGHRDGTATVTATSEGKQGSALVKVKHHSPGGEGMVQVTP